MQIKKEDIYLESLSSSNDISFCLNTMQYLGALFFPTCYDSNTLPVLHTPVCIFPGAIIVKKTYILNCLHYYSPIKDFL